MTMPVRQLLAECVAAETRHPAFVLMGNANMRLVADLARAGIRIVKARHENMAVAMADGLSRATGDVGVVSVTGGPGLSQIGNCLVIAARRRSPLVVIAGDSAAVAEADGLHAMNQRRFAEACEAQVVAVRSPQTAAEDCRNAFLLARRTPGPVVLNAPVDIQEARVVAPADHQSSSAFLAPVPPVTPCPADVATVAGLLADARCPVLLAGRGALGAARDIERLADVCGAALATTYPGKGMFAGHPADIGVVGPYGSFAGATIVVESDCVLAFGASLNVHTTQDDRAFPNARVVHVDTDPGALVAGRRPADVRVVADAGCTAAALCVALSDRLGGTNRSQAVVLADHATLVAEEIAAYPADVAANVVDPRTLITEIDAVLPAECTVVTASARSSYYPSRFLRGVRERTFINASEFGSIGHTTSEAIGVACADPSRVVVVFDGDGSLIMNIQELRTAAEVGARLLIVVLNDEAYGSELHRMSGDAEGYALSEMPSPDFVGVAAALGVRARLVTRAGQAGPGVVEFLAGDGPMLLDARISRDVPRPANLAVAAR